MPSLEEHARRSNALYGDSAEEIHEYIDSAYVVYGGAHRKIRHDTQVTPREVEEIFGEKHKNAKDISIDHVCFDAMESCCRIGVAYDSIGKLCFLRFMKPHFENTQCPTCKNSRTEKFAEVYIWVDWKERFKPRKERIIPFVSLLFTSKEQAFSDQTERWATLHYCYKCHQLGVNVLRNTDGIDILKGDRLLCELMNHVLSTVKDALSSAVGHEALLSIGVPEKTPELLETESKKGEPEKKTHAGKEATKSKQYGFPAIVFSLFWLTLGILTATSSRIAPKMLQWNYILAWMIVFAFPCLLLLWVSLCRENRGEKSATESSKHVLNEMRDMAEQKTESEFEDMHRETYPELSREETELQETREVDMDFEDEEN